MNNMIEKIAELHREIGKSEFPFHAVTEGLYGCRVFQFGSRGQETQLLTAMEASFDAVIKQARRKPIVSGRINEVGNKLEQPVIAQLKKHGLDAGGPTTKEDKGKTAGYPDILIKRDGISVYLEVKATASADSELSVLRSFYLSPSSDPKVTVDAYHLLVRFRVTSKGNKYRAIHWKLKDLHGLRCTLKQEIQSNNRSLYQCETLSSSHE